MLIYYAITRQTYFEVVKSLSMESLSLNLDLGPLPISTTWTQLPTYCDNVICFLAADEMVNQLSLVIKMLYLSDLRDVQNEINSLIALVQDYTANP